MSSPYCEFHSSHQFGVSAPRSPPKSPGDFGGERGALTPNWWEEWNSQYGLLKVWKVAEDGSYVDGMRISNVTLDQLRLEQARFISVRIGVKENARHVGGINIFGRSFGNYPQDIVLRLRFRQASHEK